MDIRRRIELIQDFDMPGVSTTVRVSNDGQYILATGIYKPRIKCFDVNNLSLKFERCFDSEAVTFEILSDDYSKVSMINHKYRSSLKIVFFFSLFCCNVIVMWNSMQHMDVITD